MKYLAKKFGSLLLTLLLVSFLSFFAFSVIPGDAAKSQLGTEATPERIEALQKEMGLDRPVLERYASWVTGFFHGDLGTSYSYSMPVGELIRDKVPITIAITVIAFLMILVVSIPIGIFTAQHAGGHLDRLIMTINQVIMSVPGFFIGILITYLFGLILKWFQPGAYVPISENFSGFIGYLVAPSAAIALPRCSMAVKMLRSSVLSQLDADYVRTAYSRGNSTRRVMYHHVLKKRPDSGTDLLGHDNRRYCSKQHYSGTGFFDSGHGQSSDHFDLQPRLPRGSGHPCTDRRPHYYHQFRGRSAVWQN